MEDRFHDDVACFYLFYMEGALLFYFIGDVGIFYMEQFTSHNSYLLAHYTCRLSDEDLWVYLIHVP